MSFLQLYPDPDARPEVKGPVVERVDIIALHGLNSGASSVERNAFESFATHNPGGTETIWLRDFLPKVVPDSRVLLYRFDVPRTFARVGLEICSREFLNLLIDIRRNDPYRPIIFIAHSLGGLVIKQALSTVFSESRFHDIKTATFGIFFFGTPHRGWKPGISLNSTILRIFSKLYIQLPPPNAVKLGSRHPNGFLSHSPPCSRFPIILQWWKPGSGDDLQVVSFYENVGSVVPKESSTLGYPREVVSSINACHRDMCRFASESDVNYIVVRDKLMFMVEEASSADSGRKSLNYQDAELLRRLYKASNGLSGCRPLKSYPGTGEWLLSYPKFSEWMSSTSGLVWIVGAAGTGKTTIANYVVNRFRQTKAGTRACLQCTHEVPTNALQLRTPKVLAFFCDYSAPPPNSVAILWSLLHQLLAEQPSLMKYVSAEVRLLYGQQTVQASSLYRLFLHVAEYLSIIIVIDALDECEEGIREDLLEAFSVTTKNGETFSPLPADGIGLYDDHATSLCDPSRTSIKVLITSRPYRDLIVPSALVIDLSEKEAAQYMACDNSLVIDSSLDSMKKQGLLVDFQKRLIREALVEASSGIFLWTKLQIKSLESYLHTSSDIDNFLLHLPRSLDETYESILASVFQKPSARDALRILQWICSSFRPLTIQELGDALMFESAVDSVVLDIPKICGSLIEVDWETSKVYLVHQTAKDYLLTNDFTSSPSSIFSDRILDAARDNLSLGLYCMKYMTLAERSFQKRCGSCVFKYHRNTAGSVECLRHYPLLNYAAANWARHFALASMKTDNKSYSNTILELVNPRSAVFKIWFPIYWLSQCTETWERKRFPEYPTELIVLAFLGDENAIRSMFRLNSSIAVDESSPAGEEWTPLMAAAWVGRENVVNLLLELGAGRKSTPQQNTRILVTTIERGHIKIAQSLIAHFANIQPSLSSSRSIFDISTKDEATTPLLSAIRGNQIDLMASLLSAGADVNITMRPRFQAQYPSWVPFWCLEMPPTPLGTAVSEQSLEAIRMLIRAGADIYNSNAIHVASSSGNVEILQFLLDHGAKVEDNYYEGGYTPLELAVHYGHADVVSLLLDHGASVEATAISKRSPLQLACEYGRLDILQILLDKNAKAWQSVLADEAEILKSSHRSIRNYLITSRGKPVSFENANLAFKQIFTNTILVNHLAPPWTALRPANESECLSLLTDLLDYGADPSFQDVQGNTPLHVAAALRMHIASKLLLDRYAAVNVQNNEGQTALDVAVQSGDTDLCRLLLLGGARGSSRTWKNALRSGSQSIVWILAGHVVHSQQVKSSIHGVAANELQIERWSSQGKTNQLPPSGGSILQRQTSHHKFVQAIRFLDSRGIENLESIELSKQDKFPFTNALKGWIEDHSGTEWIWWPLTPRLHPLGPEEVWLKWRCETGYEHSEKVSSALAQEIDQFLEFRRETFKATSPITGNPSKIYSGTSGTQDEEYSLFSDGLRREQYLLSDILTGQGSLGLTNTESSPSIDSASPARPVNLPSPTPVPNGPATRSPARPHQPAQSLPKPAGRRLRRRRARVATSPNMIPLRTIPTQYTAQAHQANFESWVLFKPGDEIVHIDVLKFSTDQLFFDELKREERKAKGWLKEWFSPWRYHHCNFDKFIRSRDNVVSSLSNGSRRSNYLPSAPHDIDYEFVRSDQGDGEAPISQMEFRNIYRACPKRCRQLLRLVHKCKGPSQNYSPNSPFSQPADHSLKLIPKKKTKWDIYRNYRGEAWGLTSFLLPSFIWFVFYFILSASGPITFWALWLSLRNHEADLQNASVPALTTLALWALLWQSAGNNWNSDRALE